MCSTKDKWQINRKWSTNQHVLWLILLFRASLTVSFIFSKMIIASVLNSQKIHYFERFRYIFEEPNNIVHEHSQRSEWEKNKAGCPLTSLWFSLELFILNFPRWFFFFFLLIIFFVWKLVWFASLMRISINSCFIWNENGWTRTWA